MNLSILDRSFRGSRPEDKPSIPGPEDVVINPNTALESAPVLFDDDDDDDKEKFDPTLPYIPSKDFDSRSIYPFKMVTVDEKRILTIFHMTIVDEAIHYQYIIQLINQLGPEDTINIFMDSPGGYVQSGLLFCSALLDTAATTNIFILGFAASCGAMIASVCDNVYVTKFSRVMFHMSSHGDMGNSMDIASNATTIALKMKWFLENTALVRGFITKEEYTRLLDERKDIYIYGDDLQERVRNLFILPIRNKRNS